MPSRSVFLYVTLFAVSVALCVKDNNHNHNNDTSLNAAARINAPDTSAPCPCIGKENLRLIREERKLLENEREQGNRLLLKEIEARRRLELLLSRLIGVKSPGYSSYGPSRRVAKSSPISTATTTTGTYPYTKEYGKKYQLSYGRTPGQNNFSLTTPNSGVYRKLPSSFSLPAQRRPPPPTEFTKENPDLVKYDIKPPKVQAKLTPEARARRAMRRAKRRANRRKILLDLENLDQAEKFPNNPKVIEQRKRLLVEDIERTGNKQLQEPKDADTARALDDKGKRVKLNLERHELEDKIREIEKTNARTIPVSRETANMVNERTKLEEQRLDLERAREKLEEERSSSQHVKYDLDRLLHKKPRYKAQHDLNMLQEKLKLEKERRIMLEDKERMEEEKKRLSLKTEAQRLLDERMELKRLHRAQRRLREERDNFRREKQRLEEDIKAEQKTRLNFKNHLRAPLTIQQEKSQLKAEITDLSARKKKLADEIVVVANSPLDSPNSQGLKKETVEEIKQLSIDKKRIELEIAADQDRLSLLDNMSPSPSPIPSTSPATIIVIPTPTPTTLPVRKSYAVSQLGTSANAVGTGSSATSPSSPIQKNLALEEIKKKEAAVAAQKLRVQMDTLALQQALEKERLEEQKRIEKENARIKQEKLDRIALEKLRLKQALEKALEKENQNRIARERLALEQELAKKRIEKENEEKLRIEQERKAQEALLAQKKLEIEKIELEKAKLERERLAQAQKELENKRLELERIRQQEKQAEQARIAAEENRIAQEAAEKKRREMIADQNLLDLAKTLADARKVRESEEKSAVAAQLAATQSPSPTPVSQEIQAGPVAQFIGEQNLVIGSGPSGNTQPTPTPSPLTQSEIMAAKLASDRAMLQAQEAALYARKQAETIIPPVSQVGPVGPVDQFKGELGHVLGSGSSGNTQPTPTPSPLNQAEILAAKLASDRAMLQAQEAALYARKQAEAIIPVDVTPSSTPSMTPTPSHSPFTKTGQSMAASTTPSPPTSAKINITQLVDKAVTNGLSMNVKFNTSAMLANFLETDRNETLAAKKEAAEDTKRMEKKLAEKEANQPANPPDSETIRLNSEKNAIEIRRTSTQDRIAAMKYEPVTMYSTLKKTVLISYVRKYDDELAKIALELQLLKKGVAVIGKQIKDHERASGLRTNRTLEGRDLAILSHKIKLLDRELLYMPAGNNRTRKLAQRKNYTDSWSEVQAGIGMIDGELAWLNNNADNTTRLKAEDEALLGKIIDVRALHQIELGKLAAIDLELEKIVEGKNETDYTPDDTAKFKQREEVQKVIEKLRADELALLGERSKLSNEALEAKYPASDFVVQKKEFPKAAPQVSPSPSPAPIECNANCMAKIKAARERAIKGEAAARERVRKAAENRKKARKAAKEAAKERARKAKQIADERNAYEEQKQQAIAQGKPIPTPPWQVAATNEQNESNSTSTVPSVSVSPTPAPLTKEDLQLRVNATDMNVTALESDIAGIKANMSVFFGKFRAGTGTPDDKAALKKLKQDHRDAARRRRELLALRARYESQILAIDNRVERAKLAKLKEALLIEEKKVAKTEERRKELEANNKNQTVTRTRHDITYFVNGKEVGNSSSIHHS